MTDTRITKNQMERMIYLLRRYQTEKITLKEYQELVELTRQAANQILFDDDPHKINYNFSDKREH